MGKRRELAGIRLSFFFASCGRWLVASSLICSAVSGMSTHREFKECAGSEGLSFSYSGDVQSHFEAYRNMYTNCTFVAKNLVITHLTAEFNLSFLQDIREVYGTVLISMNHVSKIPLLNLVVIRGAEPRYRPNMDGEPSSCSLYVAGNSGLEELQMPNLQEILAGDVLFKSNTLLRFADSIHWTYILDRLGAQAICKRTSDDSTPCPMGGNPNCDDACTVDNHKYCWGLGPNMCQNLTSLHCHQTCSDNDRRCFGSQYYQCCDSECVGGCDGHTNSDCLACKQYENDGKCVENCPRRMKQNKQTKLMEPNPDFKYHYNGQCVKTCADHLKYEGDFCVSQCSEGFQESEVNNTCDPCIGACQKTARKCIIPENTFVNRDTIHLFQNCTHVIGAILIHNSTFKGYVGDVALEELSVFETIEEISDFLYIDAYHENMTSLSFFKNLRTISGLNGYAQGSTNKYALFIMKTSVEYLGLTSLKEIRNYHLVVNNNARLCYTSDFDFAALFTGSNQRKGVVNNRKTEICAAENKTCAVECSGGCWGPGPDKCFRCRRFHFEDRCIDSCVVPNTNLPMYNVSVNDVQTCFRCHSECANGCGGPSADECLECRNVATYTSDDAKLCRATCPTDMYPDDNRRCQLCSDLCEKHRCTGPGNHPGPGGCRACYRFALANSTHNETYQCLPEDTEECSDGFYPHREDFYMTTENGTIAHRYLMVCRKCHPECHTCHAAGDHCPGACVHYEEEKRCVFNCSENYRVDDVLNTTCVFLLKAHALSTASMGSAIGIPIFIMILVAMLTLVLVRVRDRRRKRKQMLIDEIPLANTDAEPDLSNLRLIQESELRRGASIGSGAFGTVYKGVWIPPNENLKIPVAIKVLTCASSPNLDTEMLDEARVMASVRHQYCIRIAAVCMSSPMQLVTPLMPYGSLLDYIRKQQTSIGSKSLLTWSVQIARGMEYLEQRGIVHRDLAARNVLVQNPNRVKITDFGLAKLLDYNEEEFRAAAGKMPIKWLALESLNHRIYTHKSDVWSYGVTLWELYTFGGRPYDDIPARGVPDALERGVRLPQPQICTIDVYLLLIKCWLVEANSRPSFSELAMDFTRMASDPGRFLVIFGDKFTRQNSVQGTPTGEGPGLLRELSGLEDLMEGPEQVMSADDYLSPSDVSNVDGMPFNASRPFNKLVSITEECNGPYVNSQNGASGGSKQKMLDPPPTTPSDDRYIAEPVRDDQRPSQKPDPKPGQKPDLKPLPLHKDFEDAKRGPPVDDSGYLEPQSSAGPPSDWSVKGGDSSGPNLPAPPLPDKPSEMYLNTASPGGLDNPSYLSSFPETTGRDQSILGSSWSAGNNNKNTASSDYLN